MENKEIMTNYMSLLKSNIEVYVHGTIESSNENIRKMIKYGLDETLSSQERNFNIMKEKGFYDIDNVNVSEINQTYKKFKCQKE